jgi:hypothetical protein
MKLAGRVAHTEENKNDNRFVMATTGRKRQIGRLKSRRVEGWWRYRSECYGMD